LAAPFGNLSPDLKKQYDEFKHYLNSCQKDVKENCRLTNYAGVTSGARIITVRDAPNTKNILQCKCKDPDKRGDFCVPKTGPCSICKCSETKPETIIQEDGAVLPGKCWAFSGVGKVLVGLFWPVMVTGITLHHPPRGDLLVGFFSSAPKTFQLWVWVDI